MALDFLRWARGFWLVGWILEQVQVFYLFIFCFCLVRPFIELIICFKGVSVFVLIGVMMVELTKQRKKEEENKMTQNEEKAQGLVDK